MLSVRTIGPVCIVLLVALAGCSGGPGGGAGTTDGGGGGSSWCAQGETMSWSNPQTGEQATMTIKGVVQHDGRQTCKAVWTTNSGQIRKVEMYFTEQSGYTHILYYGPGGTVINEIKYTGTTSA